jgi:hypothetical protein
MAVTQQGTCSRSRPSRRFGARLELAVSSILLATVLFCDVPASGVSAAAASLEYDVKAAFLLNFTKFVEWPPGAFAAADAPLTICILGNDPFGRAIDQIVEGESVNGHKIAVERVRDDQQKSCQVLYFGSDGSNPTTLSAAGPAVLTIGEGDGFIHQGGIIGFVIDNRRVRFDINLKAATRARLKLSSKLLSVARSVEK